MSYVIWFEAWPFWYPIDKSYQCTSVVTGTLFSICERSDNEEIHGDLALRSGEQLHSICLMHNIFLMHEIFVLCQAFFPFLHLCCPRRTCTFGSSSHFASNSVQVWWSTWPPYRVFVLFSPTVNIIWQTILYCYLKEAHVVCLSCLFSIDNIFKLHPWQYGVFLNADAITTWIDLCELGCIKGLLAMVYFCLFLWRKI